MSVKQAKPPKYTKTMAARQLGVSVYRLNKLIGAGVLPDKPTEEQVEKVCIAYAAAVKKYSARVVESFEAGHSLRYCTQLIENAIDTYELITPQSESPEQFVWGVVYRHQMKERRRKA